jgi:cytochrome c-type biogenesis protein CcmH
LTPIFFAAAFLLILAVAAIMLPALLRRAPPGLAAPRHEDGNLEVLRAERAELEKERAAGNLDEAAFRAAEEELRRRLLEEGGLESRTPSSDARPSPAAACALVFLLLAGGFAGYFLLGEPEALNGAAKAETAAVPESAGAMIAKLEARLKEAPEETESWLLLARLYKAEGRFDEAVAVYEKVEQSRAKADDANFLADYAEALAMRVVAANAQTSERGDRPAAFRGKPRRLLLAALARTPDHPKALFLAGAAALEADEAQKAREHWEKLLPAVEEGSELQRLLTGQLERLRARQKTENRAEAAPQKR